MGQHSDHTEPLSSRAGSRAVGFIDSTHGMGGREARVTETYQKLLEKEEVVPWAGGTEAPSLVAFETKGCGAGEENKSIELPFLRTSMEIP